MKVHQIKIDFNVTEQIKRKGVDFIAFCGLSCNHCSLFQVIAVMWNMKVIP